MNGVAALDDRGILTDCSPAVRRQGVGAAMTLAPLRDARVMGYHAGVRRVEDAGVSVYRKLDFRPFGTMKQSGRIAQYAWSPPS